MLGSSRDGRLASLVEQLIAFALADRIVAQDRHAVLRQKNAGALVRYIRAYVAAVDWLYDPANRAEAIDILQRRVAEVSPDSAARSYDELLHPSRGSLSRKAAIDPEGVRTVLALRREFARPARPLSDPSRYYDATYYERALRNE